MDITVLCKVVDNFGDIGVVWRMIKQLHLNLKTGNCLWGRETKINLIIDDLSAFNKINHFVNPTESFQIIDEINIYDWNDYDFCYESFSGQWDKLKIILECFQCGRPDWMEKILFEDGLEKTVNIIMIDYLTGEDYADSFHLLKSLTRSAKVQKINFMPGFTEKTGGLIIDQAWENPVIRNKEGPVLFFTYERDWTGVLKAISENINDSKEVLLAQGRGKQSVLDSNKNLNNKLKIKELDFIDQQDWDELMKTCSALFIRGEESMSRACLSGIPFVWHAYPQSDEYQLVKVKALLNQMKDCFNDEMFKIVEKVWVLINSPENEVSQSELEKSVFLFMKNIDNLAEGFSKFSKKLRKNGELTFNLMTFIDKNYII